MRVILQGFVTQNATIGIPLPPGISSAPPSFGGVPFGGIPLPPDLPLRPRPQDLCAALTLAAGEGCTSCVESIIDKGADVNMLAVGFGEENPHVCFQKWEERMPRTVNTQRSYCERGQHVQWVHSIDVCITRGKQ